MACHLGLKGESLSTFSCWARVDALKPQGEGWGGCPTPRLRHAYHNYLGSGNIALNFTATSITQGFGNFLYMELRKRLQNDALLRPTSAEHYAFLAVRLLWVAYLNEGNSATPAFLRVRIVVNLAPSVRKGNAARWGETTAAGISQD
ncbi:hypothetical protein NC651_014735 [Populus alba x Populus x berolinensis]|nr:hypothetical protein NC651_014735 [Populus alba x Populus x berolinensis]